MIIETNLIVRYAETDQMGIAHHSNYLIWFEVGRSDFIKSFGIKASTLENEGILLPLIDLKCTYKKPARYEDELILKTKLSSLNKLKLTFNYAIYNKKTSLLLATGETTHVTVSKDLKPINIKKYNRKFYEILLNYIDGKLWYI